MATIEFFVPGKAEPAGSKRAVPSGNRRFANVIDANPKAMGWKEWVSLAGRKHYTGPLLTGAIKVTFAFVRQRLKGHQSKRGGIKASAVDAMPTSKPDALKQARAVEDALTGIIWKDDAQICDEVLSKRYGDMPGVWIKIEEIQ